MKRLFFLVLAALINITSQAQQRPQQNIRRITVTFQYELEKGDKTNKYWAVYQQMFDSLGRLHTEIEWDFITHQPSKFQWHSFIGKQVVKTQFFVGNSLKMIKDYTYTKDSLISQEVVTKVNPDDTSKYLIISYGYNALKKPEQVEAKLANGKVAYKSKYTYDNKGSLLTLKVKAKKDIYPLDSIIEMTCIPQYDSIGRMKSNHTSILKYGKSHEIKNFFYTYDKKNRMIGISVKNDKGMLISREERIYDSNRNRIQQIKLYNSSNALVKWLALRYELYKTNDLRFSEIDY